MQRLHARNAAAFAAVLILAAAGCAHQYLDPGLYGQVREPIPDYSPGAVQVRFLGVGGFLIQRGSDVILTAPFYTNPDVGFLFGRKQVRPNERLICDLLPKRWAKDASAILVGHTHYDHFMDVPFVASKIAPNAKLYGSLTMKYLAMAKSFPEKRVEVVTDQGGKDLVDYRPCQVKPKEACHYRKDEEGDWIKVNDRVRIRALCSRHAPPIPWKGCLTQIPKEPTKVQDWKLGDTYAYLIDFLDETTDKAVFRIYYQDSATSPTYGFVPDELVADKKVDLALLCAAAFGLVKDNPARIVENTDPRYVIYGHWESFFRPQTKKPLEALWVFDYSALVDRMEALARPSTPFCWKGQYWIAAPGNLFVFEPTT